jgi:hypothetical protein
VPYLKALGFLFFVRFLALFFMALSSAERIPNDISRKAITTLIVTKAKKTACGKTKPQAAASSR